MTARERKEKKTTQYLSDVNNFRSFISELKKYIKKHMICCRNRMEISDPYILKKHFIRFCNIKGFAWWVADEFIRDEDEYGCLCDCDYIYSLRLDKNGKVVLVY